jgi:cobalt-zinc-cadmium efflux system membrane fusion protein
VHLTKEAAEENHIKIESVGKRLLIPTFIAPARVAFNAEAMAHVGSVVPGRVEKINVRLGDTVHEGEELLVVKSVELGEAQSDYLQKRTAVAAATAAVDPVRIAYERGKLLYDQSQGIALAEVQKREADLKAARAALEASIAASTAAGRKLGLLGMNEKAIEQLMKTGELTPIFTVRAPIGGQVIARDVSLGALVTPDKDSLMMIADLGTLWVLADVPEGRLGELKLGAGARLKLAALPAETFAGTVGLIAPALDINTRTVQVRIVVKNDKGLLKPGMYALAAIESGQEKKPEPVVAVPDDVVQLIDGQTVVFIPVAGVENKFKRVDVKTGATVDGWTAILSGLKEGEKIVTEGAFILKAQLAKPAEE